MKRVKVENLATARRNQSSARKDDGGRRAEAVGENFREGVGGEQHQRRNDRQEDEEAEPRERAGGGR